MEIVEVSAAAGVPVSFVREGRTWHVGAVPVRWFERVDWWKTAQRLARDQMYHMDIEVWQVQARIGRNLKSPLVTFELVHGQDRETWSIRSRETIAA
ncbi:hypothetical protein ACX80E_15370 [Arthrobacter sp. TMN-49]